MQPVIKWTGSKRTQSERIVALMPTEYDRYFEPFLGGGSILYALHPQNGAFCGDICKPLIDLWREIRDNPHELSVGYRERWQELHDGGQPIYYAIRKRFNESKDPADFLFLTRTCVNGITRFNQKGEFNSAFHITRPGINPDTLEKIILDWSKRVKNVAFNNMDYQQLTSTARSGDLVYLDPPYANTTQMYYGKFDNEPFFEYLEDLNHRGVKWLLSYDGIRGDNDLRVDIPKELYKRSELLFSGMSGLNRVLNKTTVGVQESLYLNY